jgi:hypothetical protein
VKEEEEEEERQKDGAGLTYEVNSESIPTYEKRAKTTPVAPILCIYSFGNLRTFCITTYFPILLSSAHRNSSEALIRVQSKNFQPSVYLLNLLNQKTRGKKFGRNERKYCMCLKIKEKNAGTCALSRTPLLLKQRSC